MSLDFTTIKSGLVTWVNTATSLKTIWSDQDAPQPYDGEELKTIAYAALRYSTIDQINEDHVSPPDNAGIATISGDREFILFIQVKGKDALSKMSDLLDSLQKVTVQDTLRASKISYVDNFPIMNITGLDDTQYIERASMDVLFRTFSEITDVVGVIEKTEVTQTIKDQKGDTIIQETFTIE